MNQNTAQPNITEGTLNTFRSLTDLTNAPVISGKVRDIADLGKHLLFVTSDRISAFDVTFSELIPNKGKVLNLISQFWFDLTADIIPNHMVTLDMGTLTGELACYAKVLQDRSMVVKKLEMLNAECIVRGYLEGSALKSYRHDQTINGVKMPSGLRQGDKLPEVMFTPSTKANEGHDINISEKELANILGTEMATKLKEASLALYTKASLHAEACEIILADSKFEFGLDEGVLTIGDELFTPDSSRFWDGRSYAPGKAQPSFDKQYLREWLETLTWDKTPPAPTLPADIIAKTASRYLEAYTRLTGKEIK